jgi:hypothetical protein
VAWTAAVASIAAACGSAAPSGPPAPKRTTCADVLSVALPDGFTCSPRPSPVYTAAFVESPRVRLLLIAAPHLAPGDSGTDRALRPGERATPVTVGSGVATGIFTGTDALWEPRLSVFAPDAGNGSDRLLALGRWQDASDEASVKAILASLQVVRPDSSVPDASAVAPASGPASPAAPVAPSASGADPAGWLRHVVGNQLSMAAPGDLGVTPNDPAQGPNLSLGAKTFEVHAYLSPEGVRAVTAHGDDTVRSEPITVDGPQGQLHHWKRASGGRPGRPFELELQARLAPDVTLSVFASCQTAAACGTAETMLRSIRLVQRP